MSTVKRRRSVALPEPMCLAAPQHEWVSTPPWDRIVREVCRKCGLRRFHELLPEDSTHA